MTYSMAWLWPLLRRRDSAQLPGAGVEDFDMSDNKTVLVIDDVESLLHLIRGALAGCSVDLITAVDGGSGLELARELVPDLVLLDLALPVMNGWEVLEHLQQDRDLAHVPVVIVTAHGDSASAAQARAMGAVGFLSKPFRPAELRRIIDQHLTGSIRRAG